ncbi:HPP family protein [Leptolyngbya sp. NIES-2104]|uniref:HPP family protein n=1 Tax=Leptolyngbya sp. NIES-2104 TaxID=1552121 RepID=UPI0006EC79F1|nr:HPP family protein [Leptolyngbya sp. NIES-2104]GAP96052.1 CBS-domain-containing membrane protein [Leptolyngbya sp. NIES-2104]
MKKLYFRSWLRQPWKSRSTSRSIHQPQFSYRQILFCWLGSFLSIATLTYLSIHTHHPLIAAPFGATAVILYAIPDSPLAQPRNVILGNCIGAIVCVTFVQCFGTAPWVIALSVATAIKLMQLTRTLHPPGGAVALVGAMNGASWSYLLTPVLAGSLIMVGCTIAFHRLAVRKSY